MNKKYNINYNLEGLKYVKEKLERNNEVIAYSEHCSSDIEGSSKGCKRYYETVEYNMDNYPCPWDKKLLQKNKYKSKYYSRSGCKYRCLLNDTNIKKEHIIEDKEAYIEAMNNLISILETDSNWRMNINDKTLLTKSGRALIEKSAQRRKKLRKSCDFNQKMLFEYENVATNKAVRELADKFVNYAKSKNISVLRYDSKTSCSVYLKFDYGMAGSLRLSDHHCVNDMNYTFNILYCIYEPYKEVVATSKGNCDTYFYPSEMAKNAAIDVVRFRDFRKAKYGEEKYKSLVEHYKKNKDSQKGFWKRAQEIN